MKYTIIWLLLLGFLLPMTAQSPKHEVRAVWLTTIGGIDWPHSTNGDEQKKELAATLERLQKAGVNTVLIQTRVRATAIYPSSLEPWDACMTGQAGRSPGYDPLQLCIEECHRRGMECHAWVVTIPVGKWNKLGCQQLRKKFPKLIRHIGEDGFMDPEQAQTGDYLAEICREIVSRYDVDGIHLDYIRYPETWPKASRRTTPAAKRREYITDIVRKINSAVKNEKPWVKLSCSPIGKYDDLTRYKSGGWNARTAVSQDAQAWLREGLMDALFPMMYFQGNQFFPFAIDWQEQSSGRMVCPGLGIYFLDPKEGKWTLPVVEREMNVLRQLGLGHAYFRSKFLTDNVKGVYDFAARFDEVPALVPPMTWATSDVPQKPRLLNLDDSQLSWTSVEDHSGTPYILYNVYGSLTYPVDTDDPQNLMAWRLTSTSLQVPPGRYYAVRAMNRYGIEGEAVQLASESDVRHTPIGGKRLYRVTEDAQLRLPRPSTIDASYIVVEDLQGRQVSVYTWTPVIDLTTLPDGFYQLRSLGRKGRTHRLGFLYKRPEK
ncbi:MAG: family 10 glycosylhydrolase [Prevotella sp.]|nr:family 10 glycosylhydrolase [Prevotella sp.]